MRKYWIIVAIAVLVAAALWIVFPFLRGFFPAAGRGLVETVSLSRVRKLPLDELVPTRAGLMIRIRSARDIWERLSASRAFGDLKASPLWREERIEERLTAAGREFEARTGFGINRSRIVEVAGEDIALAVVPSEGVPQATVLLLARLGTRGRLMEIVLRLGDSLKAEEERLLREEVYRGEKIVTVLPSESFPVAAAYSVIDGYLAAAAYGSPRSLIKEVIDLARGVGKPLAGSNDFSAALNGAGFPAETFLEFYLSPNRFPGGLEGDLAPGSLAEAVAWGEAGVQSLKSCRAIGCRAGYREGIHTWLRIALEEEDSFGPSPRVPGDRIPLPDGEMFYGFFAVDPIRVGEVIAGLLGSMGIRGEDGSFPGLAGWERESGLDLRRDILPVLGSRWGLVLGGLTGEEFIPLPPFALVNAVADRATVAVMDRIVAWAVLARGLRPVRESYHGVEMTFFPGLLFSEPGYALWGGKLVIAGSRPMLKSVIDLSAEPRPAVQNDPLFQRVAARFDPTAGVMFYLDGEIFLNAIRAAANWYFAYQRLAPEQPVLPESVYREKIVPLLDLLRNVRGVGTALVREKNIVKTDCFIYIPGSN